MGEDFICAYEPQGGAVISTLPSRDGSIEWSSEAEEWLARVPSFVRRFVRQRAEDHVRQNRGDRVTAEVMQTMAKNRFAGKERPAFLDDILNNETSP